MNEIKSAKENIKLICIAFISSAVFIYSASTFYYDKLPNKENIVKLKGTLESNIKTERGNKGGRTLLIKLKEFPNIVYTIGSVSLRQTFEQKLIDENKIEDSVTILIKNTEYQSKIKKNKKIPFPAKYLNPKNISVVEIKNNNFTYLSLNGYNKEHKINNYLAVFFLGFLGLLMFFLGILGIKYHWKSFK